MQSIIDAIDDQNFCGPSITYRLLIDFFDVID